MDHLEIILSELLAEALIGREIDAAPFEPLRVVAPDLSNALRPPILGNRICIKSDDIAAEIASIFLDMLPESPGLGVVKNRMNGLDLGVTHGNGCRYLERTIGVKPSLTITLHQERHRDRLNCGIDGNFRIDTLAFPRAGQRQAMAIEHAALAENLHQPSLMRAGLARA